MEVEKLKRLRELVSILSEASLAYEQENREIMSNYEYDKLYDELVKLEDETGTILANSPTRKVGYEVLSSLPKEAHQSPMLSLDKTKSVSDLVEFMGDKPCLLSWKLDGLTVVLTYENGELVKAVTRGNGEIGEVITSNAKCFSNIPLKIGVKGKLVLRCEAVISYSTFEKINANLGVNEEQYKNPRNLASGSVRQLDSSITKQREVQAIVFNVVYCEDCKSDSKCELFEFVENLGFTTVDCFYVTSENELRNAVENFRAEVNNYDIPSDGLVITYDSVSYGESLGRTAKFPKHSLAFKWKDETKSTTLRDVIWQVGRTGKITPVAIFDTVDIEGSEVSRASIHNISILEDLELGYGDVIEVYKANMIIPQILGNFTCSNDIEIPDTCPVCGEETHIIQEKNSKILYCSNSKCPAKNLQRFSHFVARDAMNIEGLSEATLEKLIDCGYITKLGDIFRLDRYEYEITNMEGFGDKSYDKLIRAIEKVRTVSLPRLIYGLGIPNVGLGNAKLLCKEYNYDIYALSEASEWELAQIQGIGGVIANSVYEFFNNPVHTAEVEDLLQEVEIESAEELIDNNLEGMIFCITGAVYEFKNRDEFKEAVESRGGKVTGSVSSNTDYLVTNDTTSGSSKNLKAAQLGVKIITEQEFIDMFIKEM